LKGIYVKDLWVFAYGSLMWRPGFDYAERRPAKLYGHHRAFCVFSHVHRGTPESPGLVLGLDRGGSCRGLAYRVQACQAAQVLQYLRAREQVTKIYHEIMLCVHLIDVAGNKNAFPEKVDALCFVVDRAHHQYAGKLGADDQTRLIVQGRGQSGKNPEYLANTLQHLEEMGIEDRGLTRLWQAVARRTGSR